MASSSAGEFGDIEHQPWTTADLLWLLGSLCRLQRKPFDAGLIARQYPPPHALHTLIEAAATLGLNLSRGPFGANNEGQSCIAFARADKRAALVARIEAERVLFFPAGTQSAETLTVEEFTQRFAPQVLWVAAAVEEGETQDALAPPRFSFRWFFPELLKHKRLWRDVLLTSLALQLTALATPLFTQVIIDKVVVHQTQSTLLAVAAGLLLFLVFNAGLTWLRQYLVLHTGNRIDAVLGTTVFRHLLRLHLRYFEHRPSGTLIARLHGIETIRQFVSGAAVTLFLDLPFLFVFLGVMFWYSWQLSLIAVATVLLLTGLSLLVTPLLRERVNEQFLKGARNQAFLTEYVAGMETVKSLQLEPHLERRYQELLSDFLKAGFRARQLSNTTNTAATTIEQAQTLAVLCAGALLVMQNEGFTIGMLVAFQMFASRMAQPMLRLASLWQEFQQADIAVRRLGDLMDAPAEPYALLPSRAPGGAGALRLLDVAFRYGETYPWLYRGLNLELPPGSLTVVTGPSGCGKSTLAKLLQGFYPVMEGRIEIDGRDIRHLAANELRQHYGVVPQETVLFAGSVYENLVMANPHTSFDEVVQACRYAGIHDVIEALPQGYQTPLGEHGVGLSGGQKQRLAIARALLKRPQVLIFDEATSSLDAQTAEQFAQTVNRLRGQVTVLFIAHQIPAGLQVDARFDLGAL